MRAALWCSGEVISAEDLDQALFRLPQQETDLLALDVSQSIDIQEVLSRVARHYIHRALTLTGQNKTRAASLLGLKSQQTLSNWMDKHGIE
ncbi:hypothetical protein D3C84_1056590 [compost metagenome]